MVYLTDNTNFNKKPTKYVLISDIAGNGKSWAMKNLTKVLLNNNPSSWVSYVDLKQFIEEFQAQDAEPEFQTFMIEKILKLNSKFEQKLFEKLYKNGKVFVLFDGFDEIAPNCAEFVSNLAKSFESNGSNQLWIATREYFQVDLQKNLEVKLIYEMSKFSEDDGVDLIATNWMLMDIKDINSIKSRKDFDKFMKKSANFQNYQETARKIVKKVAMSQNHLIGMPQLFKMIADSFKNDKNSALSLKDFLIFKKFAKNLYKRWSDEKGLIRKESSIESQSNELNFWKFHQYSAIKSFFPELLNILFPEYDGSEWPVEEIIACGLMSKLGDLFYFLHETFREFFVADVIAQVLKKSNVDEEVIEIFVKILTSQKCEVVRMFLNDAIDNYTNLQKIQPKVEEFIEEFYKIENFKTLFIKNLQHFAKFVLEIFKNGDYEKVKKILIENFKEIFENSKNSEIFLIFSEFLINFLKVDDLKKFLIEREMFQNIFKSNLDIFEEFLDQVESKTGRKFVRFGLKLYTKDGNIFSFLNKSENVNSNKVQKCLNILQKYLKIKVILKLMKYCNSHEMNIFHICFQCENSKNLILFITEIKMFLDSKNLSQHLKKFISQKIIRGISIVHFAAQCCGNIEYKDTFITFWGLLLEYYTDRDELKNLILLTNENGESMIYFLVTYNKSVETFEYIFKSLKDIFGEDKFEEILKSKDKYGKNLLCNAMNFQQFINNESSHDSIPYLWNYFKNLFKNDAEFLKYIMDVDNNGNNILHNILSLYSFENFKFTFQEIEKIASKDDIKNLLSNCDNFHKQNILQAVSFVESVDFHLFIWEIFRKYFTCSELLKIVKHVCKLGQNLLFKSALFDKIDIAEITWFEIKRLMNKNEQIEYLKSSGFEGENLENFYFKREMFGWVLHLLHSNGIKIEILNREVKYDKEKGFYLEP